MGIVLMELVSGKMPTDEAFGVDLDMVRWMETHIELQGPSREELIDLALKPMLPGEEHAAFQILEIGLQCTKIVPQERPSSRQVCDLVFRVFNQRMIEFEKLNMDSRT